MWNTASQKPFSTTPYFFSFFYSRFRATCRSPKIPVFSSAKLLLNIHSRKNSDSAFSRGTLRRCPRNPRWSSLSNQNAARSVTIGVVCSDDHFGFDANTHLGKKTAVLRDRILPTNTTSCCTLFYKSQNIKLHGTRIFNTVLKSGQLFQVKDQADSLDNYESYTKLRNENKIFFFLTY